MRAWNLCLSFILMPLYSNNYNLIVIVFRVYILFYLIISLVLLLQILSVQQLCKICTLYWDDNYNTRSVSPHVSLCLYFLQSHKRYPWNGKCLIDAFKYSFRSLQAWGWTWTPMMLWTILSCWMTVPGEGALLTRTLSFNKTMQWWKLSWYLPI